MSAPVSVAWLRLAALAVAALATLLPAKALGRGGALEVPCDRPFTSSLAAVNIVVLPYEFPPQLAQRSRAANLLSVLVQRQVSQSVARHGINSMFAVHLVRPRNGECEVDTVRDQLLGRSPGAQYVVAPGKALVLVWGRLFRSNDELFVQTFVQFVRRGVPEEVAVEIEGQIVSGELSGQGFAGLQRNVTRKDLKEVERLSREVFTIYERPADDAPHAAKTLRGRRFHYTVAEMKQGWLRVESAAPPRRERTTTVTLSQDVHLVGWIKATPQAEDGPLRRLIPEVGLLEAIASYLAIRVETAEGAPMKTMPRPGEERRRAAVRSLEEYGQATFKNLDGSNEVSGTSGHEFATAIPLQMAGILELESIHSGSTGSEGVGKAFAWFSRAASLLPADANARNLFVVAGLKLATIGSPFGLTPKRAESVLLDAIALDPTNAQAPQNLASLYQLRLNPSQQQPPRWEMLTPDQRVEIELKLQRVRNITKESAAHQPR